MSGWIGVDLDGTLAHYDGWRGVAHIGEPVPDMLDRVRRWVASGIDVRVFTARVGRVHSESESERNDGYLAKQHIEEWLIKHLGQKLPVTCVKDFGMIELWDDRCVRVIVNTGRPCCDSKGSE